MNNFSPGSNGCVNVVIKLKHASVLAPESKFSKELGDYLAKSSYGVGSISNLNLAPKMISFTVNGPCNFCLDELENIVIRLGGDVALSEGTFIPKSHLPKP